MGARALPVVHHHYHFPGGAAEALARDEAARRGVGERERQLLRMEEAARHMEERRRQMMPMQMQAQAPVQAGHGANALPAGMVPMGMGMGMGMGRGLGAGPGVHAGAPPPPLPHLFPGVFGGNGMAFGVRPPVARAGPAHPHPLPLPYPDPFGPRRG
jgi:hypothetical protein